MKKYHQSKVTELLDILKVGGVYTTKELAKELDISQQEVRMLVKQARKQVLGGKDVPWIYTTGEGYSTDDEKEYAVFESGMRMKIGFGVLVNGIPVFQKCRQIAGKELNQLCIEFRPKLLTIDGILKKR
jgi:predicted small secreted protein